MTKRHRPDRAFEIALGIRHRRLGAHSIHSEYLVDKTKTCASTRHPLPQIPVLTGREVLVEAAGGLYRLSPRKTRVDRKGTEARERRKEVARSPRQRIDSCSVGRKTAPAARHGIEGRSCFERGTSLARCSASMRSSASRKRRARPDASAIPAFRAALTPRADCRTRRIRGSEVTIDSTASAVPSSDPSSTTIASQSPYVWAVSDSSVSTTVSEAFRAGTTTDTRTDE